MSLSAIQCRLGVCSKSLNRKMLEKMYAGLSERTPGSSIMFISMFG